MNGEMEEADYQAQCQAEAEAEGEAMAAAEAENEANIHNEGMRAQEEQCLLYDLREAINKLEGVKIPFNIIKHNIQPLKEWLDSILPKKEVKPNSSQD